MPSEQMDRQEMVVLYGEKINAPGILRMDGIVRDGNGKYFGLSPMPSIGGNLSGRFSNLLPNKIVPLQLRELAKTVLTVKGFKVAGTAPRRR